MTDEIKTTQEVMAEAPAFAPEPKPHMPKQYRVVVAAMKRMGYFHSTPDEDIGIQDILAVRQSWNRDGRKKFEHIYKPLKRAAQKEGSL